MSISKRAKSVYQNFMSCDFIEILAGQYTVTFPELFCTGQFIKVQQAELLWCLVKICVSEHPSRSRTQKKYRVFPLTSMLYQHAGYFFDVCLFHCSWHGLRLPQTF